MKHLVHDHIQTSTLYQHILGGILRVMERDAK